MKIYLDNAATTRLDPRVLADMKPYLTSEYGNASSIHYMGQKNNLVLEAAREKVSKILGAPARNFIFTSGASEANNLIIKGVMLANTDKGKHLIVSAIEHPCVLQSARQLIKLGFELDIAPVNSDGLIDLIALEKMIRPDTVLVSVMLVNNEIGTIQDIKSIAKLVHDKGAYFHSDIVQAIPYLNINIEDLGLDFASLSAHKFHGPKGVGLAYLNYKIKVEPLIIGGEQENGFRAGTYNIAGIVGLASALELAYQERDKSVNQVRELRDYFWSRIKTEIPEVHLNGSLEYRTPNNLNILFSRIEGEAILMDLSMKGICVSTGSACSAHNLKTSYVLQAVGLTLDNLNSNIRFTLGKFNEKRELDYTVEALKKTIRRLRKFTPIKK
ncbi:MAG: cysteine desulfurase family protein [Candidatus Falkowbacteria bacterium]